MEINAKQNININTIMYSYMNTWINIGIETGRKTNMQTGRVFLWRAVLSLITLRIIPEQVGALELYTCIHIN